VRSSRSSSCAIAGRTCTRQADPRLQLIAGHCGCSRGDAPPARCVVAAAARPRIKPLRSGAAQLGPHRRPCAIPPPSPFGCATALPQGCCFVKFNSLIAAQSAINALHNQRSLPPLRNPLQVRFADSGINSSDRGHQTNAENKLFVGGVPTGCGDKELRALFSTYGEVLDVYILASKASQEGQRGCAFVRYSTPTSCAMAIEALHGKYAMKTGELPLVVRYAYRL